MSWMQTFLASIKNSFFGMFAAIEVANRAWAGMLSTVQKSYVVTNIAKRFGVATVELRALGEVAEEIGLDLDTVGRLLGRVAADARKAQSGMGGLKQVFDDLGISIEDLQKMSPTELLLQIAKGMEGLSPSKRALALQKLFGNQAPAAQQLIGQGEEFLRSKIADQASGQPSSAADMAIKEFKMLFKDAGDWLGNKFTLAFATIIDFISAIVNAFGVLYYEIKGLIYYLGNKVGMVSDEENAIVQKQRMFMEDKTAYKAYRASNNAMEMFGIIDNKEADAAQKWWENTMRERYGDDWAKVLFGKGPKDVFGEASGDNEGLAMDSQGAGISSLAQIAGGGDVYAGDLQGRILSVNIDQLRVLTSIDGTLRAVYPTQTNPNPDLMR